MRRNLLGLAEAPLDVPEPVDRVPVDEQMLPLGWQRLTSCKQSKACASEFVLLLDTYAIRGAHRFYFAEHVSCLHEVADHTALFVRFIDLFTTRRQHVEAAPAKRE
jgi:hypothetical protein